MHLRARRIPQFVKLPPELVPHRPTSAAGAAACAGDGIPRFPVIVLGVDDPEGVRVEGHAHVAARTARHGRPLADQTAHGHNLVAGLAPIDEIVLTFDEQTSGDAAHLSSPAAHAATATPPSAALLDLDLLIIGVDRHTLHDGKFRALARVAVGSVSRTQGGLGQCIVLLLQIGIHAERRGPSTITSIVLILLPTFAAPVRPGRFVHAHAAGFGDGTGHLDDAVGVGRRQVREGRLAARQVGGGDG